MRFLSVRELRGNTARIWEDLPNEREMVVMNNGRPVAILTSVAEGNLEEDLSAIRRARAISAVARMQRASIEKGLDALTQDDIAAEITAVRRKRAR